MSHDSPRKSVNEMLIESRRKASLGGGIEKIRIQNSKGKLTARQRIEAILDPGSFTEFDLYATTRSRDFGMDKYGITGDGVLIGQGTIHGRTVVVYSQDFTVLGGSLGEVHASKIVKAMEIAQKLMVPIIGINDSGGARIQEGVNALAGYGEIFQRNIDMSGVVPQISLIMGPCAGGAVYSPALTDFTFMVDNISYMFVTGPDVVKSVTGEEISKNDLGGTDVHTKKTGVSDRSYANDVECIMDTRRLMSYLPLSNKDETLVSESYQSISELSYSLNNLVPDDSNISYNMMNLINKVVDNGIFFPIKPNFAQNLITGFARMGGKSVGIIANQPMHLAGCLDINASFKGARFIRFCDAFNIPIVSFIDVPGFLPGSDQEHSGIIKHGAKLLYAYGEATVPKVSVITRKAYGGAYIVMNSKHLRGDVNYAWANTEIAVMGSKGAVQVLHRKDLKDDDLMKQHQDEYEQFFSNPMQAASRGFIDDIIRPQNTRKRVIDALRSLERKVPRHIPWKKHDNLPL